MPRISVVLVSDYGAGPGADAEICQAAAALAHQDIAEPVEFLLVHHSDSPAFRHALPQLRVLPAASPGSFPRKNQGVRAASGDWVALLDADCIPSPAWLRSLIAAADSNPETAAVSGPTFYSGRDLTSRVLSLLARAYLDPGVDGETRYIANNNCLMRRDVYLACPLPEHQGTFSAHIQSEALLRQGHRFRFIAAAAVTHAFHGWRMERDLRRNTGYMSIHCRRLDPSQPHAWLARLSWLALPLLSAGRFVNRVRDLIRCRARYSITWPELPSAVALTALVQALEVPGILRAIQRRPLGPSMWQ
jgi:hypothetical protein